MPSLDQLIDDLHKSIEQRIEFFEAMLEDENTTN